MWCNMLEFNIDIRVQDGNSNWTIAGTVSIEDTSFEKPHKTSVHFKDAKSVATFNVGLFSSFCSVCHGRVDDTCCVGLFNRFCGICHEQAEDTWDAQHTFVLVDDNETRLNDTDVVIICDKHLRDAHFPPNTDIHAFILDKDDRYHCDVCEQKGESAKTPDYTDGCVLLCAEDESNLCKSTYRIGSHHFLKTEVR